MKRRKRRSVSTPVPVRIFRCLECGALNPATKWRGVTHSGHIKTFWCYRCGKDTDQEQVDTR